MSELTNELTKEQAQNILTDIQNAKYHILFDCFIFGAGRTDDQYSYTITDENGNKVGNVSVALNLNYFYIEFGEAFFDEYEYVGEKIDIAINADKILTDALVRDDKEYVDIAGIEDGMVRMPGDYGDLDREAILTGSWKFCEGFT